MSNGDSQHNKSSITRSPLEELFDLALKTCVCEDRTTGSYALQETEQNILSEWGSKNGLLISKEGFELFLLEGSFEAREGGNEHDVFTSPGNVGILKVTKTENGYGARSRLVNYLENLIFSNILFGDNIHLLGIIDEKNARQVLKLMIAQPFIEGNPASQQQITNYMSCMRFEKIAEHSYKHPCGTTIHDARPDNVFISPDGLIFPIDVQVINGGNYLYHLICLYICSLASI